MSRQINANRPRLWKSDIAASVDQFNQWFMRFAPVAFRTTRVKTTVNVKAALLATRDLRSIDAATLKDNPGALSTLRMCTAPPLAVDRLIGLANASKNLVGRMEDGKLPTKMNAAELKTELTKLCRIISRLLDRDIFPWLDAAKDPTDHERDQHQRSSQTAYAALWQTRSSATPRNSGNSNSWAIGSTPEVTGSKVISVGSH